MSLSFTFYESGYEITHLRLILSLTRTYYTRNNQQKLVNFLNF
ncbi:protein of unknown function [Latilactobacillus sakei]|nr:protein of unknown function [Latilactobacillus sakei]